MYYVCRLVQSIDLFLCFFLIAAYDIRFHPADTSIYSLGTGMACVHYAMYVALKRMYSSGRWMDTLLYCRNFQVIIRQAPAPEYFKSSFHHSSNSYYIFSPQQNFYPLVFFNDSSLRFTLLALTALQITLPHHLPDLKRHLDSKCLTPAAKTSLTVSQDRCSQVIIADTQGRTHWEGCP